MKNVFFALLLFLSITSNAQQQRPKLVVGIVVDQMKMEYLYRFSGDFSSNGFKRLLNQGHTFSNMHYNYLPTYTAPGHASIYTGATPAIHGIVGNEWFSRKTGTERYCTDDDAVETLGNGLKNEGKMSPKNLLSTTITDELRLVTNFKGKVIGMSLKDRGAILPAGHFANWAFWYSKTGSFISSTFYGTALPGWVNDFNNEKNYETYLSKPWELLKPIETYNESLADLVKNINTKERLLEYKGALIQQINPIFQDPNPSGVLDYRTAFFFPEKNFLGLTISTYIFNILVIWLMSIGLYLTLYFELLRKLISSFEKVNIPKQK